jgi:hypothetical protein
MRTFEEEFLEICYRQDSQRYIEIYDEYKGLRGEIAECIGNNITVPNELMVQYEKYSDSVKNLREACWIRFGKDHKDLYNDGWKYWMEEDAKIREQRYGQ